ncbi:MAG: hypothetical protein H7X94_04895 [Vallitaleaceae bacterium]|nr:hypothetical protein [Vallitaleaceae bacterium]
MLKDQKGATSIFVMIFMVVLLVFGLAALTTSLASLKLADKNHNWSKEYYALEANAEVTVAAIDGILYAAEVTAREYVLTKQYLNSSGTFLENENQSDILKQWQLKNQVMDQEAFLEQLLQFVYVNRAYNALKDYVQMDETLTFKEWEVSDLSTFEINFSVKEEKSAYPKILDASLSILLPNYDLNLGEDGAISGFRMAEPLKRYQITQWKEWQSAFEYADDINFENPEFEDPDFGEPGSASDVSDVQDATSGESVIEEESAQDGVFGETNN